MEGPERVDGKGPHILVVRVLPWHRRIQLIDILVQSDHQVRSQVSQPSVHLARLFIRSLAHMIRFPVCVLVLEFVFTSWAFSIPPPFVNTSHTDGIWEGLDNAAWGSHIYFSSVAQFDRTVRDAAGDTWYGGRPMTLTKFARPDWRAGMSAAFHAEHPSHHRYPVW